MGNVASCVCCGPCCSGDDAKQDTASLVVDFDEDNNKKSSGWCVDDSATERIFIPDVFEGGGRELVHSSPPQGRCPRVRDRQPGKLTGPITESNNVVKNSVVLLAHAWCLKREREHKIVVVDQVRARRAHITKPIDGWASLSTEGGYVILEAIARPTKYKVVFREGIFVRSTASIEEGRIVRIAPFGTTLSATGKTEIFDGVERVQVDGGWVSMRLREDRGSGAPLIMPLN